MSTRSSITVKCSDNIIRSVYCHFDGYLSDALALIVQLKAELARLKGQ